MYANGKASGTLPLRLFANSAGSGCASLQVGYYHDSKVLMSSAPIPIDPMIQQMHLSMTSDPTEMVVDFVSSAGGVSPVCRYGSSSGALTSSAVADSKVIKTIGNVSHALLQGLAPGQTVFYECGDSAATSTVMNFTAGAGAARRVAVWADFGVNDGFGLDQIARDAEAGLFDFALHAGDWAYDLETGNSANGNFFMNRAMLYSANFPVQPAPGVSARAVCTCAWLSGELSCECDAPPLPQQNHEAGADFFEYQVRHPGVAAHSNTGSALFYSFEAGLVHYLVFNSETYIAGGIAKMLAFMAADLAAVNRTRTPWVVAYSHKLYWMDATDFSSITTILQDNRVDLLFAGHWHYYERYIPFLPTTKDADAASVSPDGHTYTRPKYVTMIVSGAPGDVERNDACPGDPSLKSLVPTCTAQYGYGIMTVHNASALYWAFTADPTPIGDASGEQHRRTPFRQQAGYSDYLWLLK